MARRARATVSTHTPPCTRWSRADRDGRLTGHRSPYEIK